MRYRLCGGRLVQYGTGRVEWSLSLFIHSCLIDATSADVKSSPNKSLLFMGEGEHTPPNCLTRLPGYSESNRIYLVFKKANLDASQRKDVVLFFTLRPLRFLYGQDNIPFPSSPW